MRRRIGARAGIYAAGTAVAGLLCLAIAACTSGGGSGPQLAAIAPGVTTIAKPFQPEPGQSVAVKTERPGPGSEVEGAEASPLVVADGEPIPRGGGRYQVGKPYQIAGKWYEPRVDTAYDEVGPASWYGGSFHGRLTANGEVFDAMALSAAHPTLPLPSYVRVTNLANDRSIIVRVNDRGPYSHKRLIDVSQRTAELLGFKHRGKTDVRVEYVDRASLDGDDEAFLLASYQGPDVGPARGGEIAVAAAAPVARPRAADAPPIQLAAAAAPPKPEPARQAPSVAFAADEGEAGRSGDVAFEAVTSAYDPGARISMAFETASATGY